jgi:hypothetical protein
VIERQSGDGGNRTHEKVLPRESSGYVYFILDLARPEVKIGHTINLEERCRHLSRQHPDRDLRLIGYFRGGVDHEQALHQRFASGALGHEWFRWDTPGLEDFASDASTFEAFFWPSPADGWPGDVMPDGSMSDFSQRVLEFYAEVSA